jgi:hypothetical protein
MPVLMLMFQVSIPGRSFGILDQVLQGFMAQWPISGMLGALMLLTRICDSIHINNICLTFLSRKGLSNFAVELEVFLA